MVFSVSYPHVAYGTFWEIYGTYGTYWVLVFWSILVYLGSFGVIF